MTKNALIEQLENLINTKNIKLLTVDIFDTLLTRDCAHESEKFLNLCTNMFNKNKKLFNGKVMPLDLFIIRKIAAEVAYKNTNHCGGSREATLNEITSNVSEILKNYGIALSPDYLRSFEIDFESKILTFNLDIVNLISKKDKDGLRVKIITDMYMQETDVRRLFEKIDYATYKKIKHLQIISSADHKYTKSNGMLFSKVISDNKVRPDEVLHVGDNDENEIEVAYRMGINAKLVEIDQEKINQRKLSKRKVDEIISLEAI